MFKVYKFKSGDIEPYSDSIFLQQSSKGTNTGKTTKQVLQCQYAKQVLFLVFLRRKYAA